MILVENMIVARRDNERRTKAVTDTERMNEKQTNYFFAGQTEVDYMRRATILVFEILEKAWALRDCALIDMKIEFGIDTEGK